MRAGVVVDIGGSGARLALVRDGAVTDVRSVAVSSADELTAAVRAADPHPSGVGLAVTGRIDSDTGVVAESRAAGWAEGPLRDQLIERLDTPVSVLGDGDAHALALTRVPDVRFGGVAVSLGTSLAFGALDRHGALFHPCAGTGWDLGSWRLTDEGGHTEAWWGLGGHGLYDLERELGDGAAAHYGYRLGGFLVDVVHTFRPRTVLLTGGVVTSLGRALHGPVAEQLLTLPVSLDPPRVVYTSSRHTALFGAAVAAGLPLRDPRPGGDRAPILDR